MNPADPFERVRQHLFGDDAEPSAYRKLLKNDVLIWSGSGTSESNNQGRDTKMASKSNYNVTLPATLVVVVSATDEKDAIATAAKNAAEILSKSFGVLTVVGEAKASPVGAATSDKKTKAAPPKDDDEEEEDDEDEEDDDEDEDEEEDDEEDEDEEEEDDEDEEPAPKKKSKDKGDKKPEKSGEKKKVKIKLRS